MSTSGSVCCACASIIARAASCDDSFTLVISELVAGCDAELLKEDRTAG